MARGFSWQADGNLNTNPELAQYLRGVNQVPGADIDLDGAADADGPEYDTIVGLDIRSWTISAWIRFNRYPAATDPYGFFATETFDIFSRSSIAGDDHASVNFRFRGDAGGGPPQGLVIVERAGGLCFSRGLIPTLPGVVNPSYCVFMAGTIDVTLSPAARLYYGDLTTPVSEIPVYGFTTDGDGITGEINPGVKVSTGQWVDRWGFGPALIGLRSLPVPVNGPGQFYGEFGPTNTQFGHMDGAIARVNLWPGVKSAAELELIRQSAISGVLVKTLGLGTPHADWPLDASSGLFDMSGNGHDLEQIGPVTSEVFPGFGVVESSSLGNKFSLYDLLRKG